MAPTLPDEGEDEDMKNAAERRAKATPQKKALKNTKLDPRSVFNPKYRLMDCGGGGACGHNGVAIGASRVKPEKWEDVQEGNGSAEAALFVGRGFAASSQQEAGLQKVLGCGQPMDGANGRGSVPQTFEAWLILFEEMEDTSAESRWRLQL